MTGGEIVKNPLEPEGFFLLNERIAALILDKVVFSF